MVSILHSHLTARFIEERMWKVGMEHFCKGCQEVHYSSVWYYQTLRDKSGREWLCGSKYHTLSGVEMAGWHIVHGGF